MPLQKVGSTRPGWSGDTCECKHTHRVTQTITALLCWSNRVTSKAHAQSWAQSILSADSVCLSSWHAQLGGVRSPTRTVCIEKIWAKLKFSSLLGRKIHPGITWQLWYPMLRQGHCKLIISCTTNTTFSKTNGESIVNLRAELSVSNVIHSGNNCWLLPPSQHTQWWYIRERMVAGTPLEILNKRIFSTSSSVSWPLTDQGSHSSCWEDYCWNL